MKATDKTKHSISIRLGSEDLEVIRQACTLADESFQRFVVKRIVQTSREMVSRSPTLLKPAPLQSETALPEASPARAGDDPLLGLIGSGADVWRKQSADEHVSDLRAGWERP